MTATGSLAYRRNIDAIQQGHVPDKYRRLLPYITGQHILEIGAAEGVQALLVADRDPAARVTALELSPARHAVACDLQARWRGLGRRVDGCTMVCGDIRERLDLLAGVETVVAVRAIYYLQESLADVFTAIAAAGVSTVVLCGNPNRARWPDCVGKAVALGSWNRYAGVPGMTEVLTAAGYTIGPVVQEGDPIVLGHR